MGTRTPEERRYVRLFLNYGDKRKLFKNIGFRLYIYLYKYWFKIYRFVIISIERKRTCGF